MRADLFLGSLGLMGLAAGADVLSTSGFSECGNGAQDVTVSQFELSFDRETKLLTFAVAGNSKVSENVTAQVNVTALGNQVYTKTFNPCEFNIQQLCPIPQGPFHANGNLTIPDQYVSQIPAVAFSVPDIDGAATLQLIGDHGQTVSCLTSVIQNGKSTEQKSVTYATLGIAGAALILSGVASLGSLGAAGASSAGPNSGAAQSPNFGDILQWFQFIAFSGMYSVNYPPVYRNFCKNFAWSTGLVTWGAMQESIDSFRGKTGGNLTTENYASVKNSTLIFTNPTSLVKRQVDFGLGDGNSTAANSTSSVAGAVHYVQGIEAFVEGLYIPSANTFMTVLLIFMIVLAAVAVGMLLVKLILELWAMCGTLSKRFEKLRKNYWIILSTTIVRIVLIVYGTWALYCLYQFKTGDSWAASLLAGATLAIFTAVLGWFTFRIIYLASKAKKQGGVEELYEHKPWMKKYGFFYDQFKSKLWWFFVPILFVSFIRAVFLVFGAGNGMVQAIGILALEGIFLVLLFWRRPYDGRGANVVNAMIAVTRVLSIVCILVFVEQLGISRTTQTITGVVLIAIQSTLTIILALLIVISAIASCFHKRKPNPARKSTIITHDDDLGPIPAGDKYEMGSFPTKKGYIATATSEQAYLSNTQAHRATSVVRDPFLANPNPVYQEYSSSYGSHSRPASVATRNTNVGHGRAGSMGHDSSFQYRPVETDVPPEDVRYSMPVRGTPPPSGRAARFSL